MTTNASLPVIGVITNSLMRQEFVISLLQARELGAEIIIYPSGPYLDTARNYVVERWMKEYPDHDWLVFIDDDIEFNYRDIIRLCGTHRRPVVSGVYMNPFFNGVRPVVFKWGFDSQPSVNADSFITYTLPELLEQPRDDYGLIHVDAVGTGCLAIHKSVPRIMLSPNPGNNNEPYFNYPMPWFAETTINGVHLGEDLTFCARLKILEIPVCVDPTVQVGHVKYFKFHPSQVENFVTLAREEVNANV